MWEEFSVCSYCKDFEENILRDKNFQVQFVNKCSTQTPQSTGDQTTLYERAKMQKHPQKFHIHFRISKKARGPSHCHPWPWYKEASLDFEEYPVRSSPDNFGNSIFLCTSNCWKDGYMRYPKRLLEFLT